MNYFELKIFNFTRKKWGCEIEPAFLGFVTFLHNSLSAPHQKYSVVLFTYFCVIVFLVNFRVNLVQMTINRLTFLKKKQETGKFPDWLSFWWGNTQKHVLSTSKKWVLESLKTVDTMHSWQISLIENFQTRWQIQVFNFVWCYKYLAKKNLRLCQHSFLKFQTEPHSNVK